MSDAGDAGKRDVIDPQQLAAALDVLARVAEDRAVLAGIGADERERLQRLAGEIARPDLKQRRKLQKALLRKEVAEKKAADEALRRSTGIQRLRATPVFATPPPPALLGGGSLGRPTLSAGAPVQPVERGVDRDQHRVHPVELGAPTSSGVPPQPGPNAGPLDTHGERVASGAPLPARATDANSVSPGFKGERESSGLTGERERPDAQLHTARKCYVCKAPYRQVHAFYDQMCPACGDENLAHRQATVDLRGRVALVTGARVKIGYHAAIMLLRAGCTVVACTRFPRDAAARYAREPDFEAWKDRLQVYGVDLRHTPSVELLCHHLDETLPRLDFQLHNACQTVRRPPGFYAHLVEGEQGPLDAAPEPHRRLLAGYEALRRELATHRPAAGVTNPALLSQVASDADLLLPGRAGAEIFPDGVLDQDLQQLDLRAHNSWRLTLAEVPTLELLEVLLVNATAPFVMTGRLKPLMLRARAAPPDTATSADGAKHVVLVSAMEGQFYRDHKTDKHPHTNMAKAALNMIVRTSAPDYAKDGIHLNAVDTGWVTDEDPAHLAARKVEEHAFSPPLDVVDGAARIVAPIFEGFRTGAHPDGIFFKDYRPAPW